MSRGLLATIAISTAAVFASACATHRPVQAQPPTAPVAETQPADATPPPLVTENPDGTVTIQKPPTEGKKGLVIKPQVIKPTTPPEGSQSADPAAPDTQP